MAKENSSSKARYWVGILYPENMIDDWEEEIASKLQIPYCYCVHDKCKDKSGAPRKAHVHLMLVFNNTTTYNHALNTFKKLEADGKNAINTCERVQGVRWMYDYLIHNTDDAKKKNKHQYDMKERISGNNFDIGAYEQISLTDEDAIIDAICNIIEVNEFTNFFDINKFIRAQCDSEYKRVFRKHQSYFNNIVKGLYHKKMTKL